MHETAAQRCTTSSVNGKRISARACIFPFRYNGINHYECTRTDSEKPWCAYEVDAAGKAITGKWGDCDSGCTKLGKILIIAFNNQQTYRIIFKILI